MRTAKLLLGALSLAAAAPLAPDDGKRDAKAPGSASTGKAYEWKTAGGSPYEYYVPKSYDPKAGANLVVILHGNGMSYQWGLANLELGKFRPDDVLVSIEGPTFLPATGALEFLDSRDDCVKVREILVELKKTFQARQTFLYGHSQGSFFVFRFAGEFPDDVSGVVGQSGALWMTTPLPKSGHKQAIAFLHGSDDANVPWFQSVDGRKAYRDADYPLVHLRTLWGHPHAPVWQQTNAQLAWCEGTTSADASRVAACLETLSDESVPYGADFAALHAVAARLETMAGATAAQKASATKAKGAVEKVAKSIASAIDASLGKGKLTKVDGKPWLGLALRFLEDFDGVDACAAWAKAHASELAAIDKVAADSGREFWQQKAKDKGKALAAGLEVLEKGWRNANARGIAVEIEPWLADEKGSGVGKKELARARQLLDAWKKGLADGFEACEKAEKSLDL
jgi:predicted esterase